MLIEFSGSVGRPLFCVGTDYNGCCDTYKQAIECDLPIVTMAGRFMRGRLASGVLYRIQLEELVAGDASEYVTLVSKVCQDTEYRGALRARIRKNKSSLYHNQAPIRALERFFLAECRAPTLD